VIALDASALADWLLQTPVRGPAVARHMLDADGLGTLDLAWLEVASALRRKHLAGDLSVARARTALGRLELAPIRRYPAAPLLWQVWGLRDSHSAYDAAYVALAEVLDVPLVTTDGALARSHGHRARVVHIA